MRFIRDVKKYFRYIIFASKSQLRSEVENSYLDWIWWVLEPLCNMIVYTIIFGYVFNAKEPNFPIFIFIGISIWTFFSKTLNASVKLIKTSKKIITKVYIPKQILIIKLMAVNAVKMSLAFIIVIIMMIFYKVTITPYVLYTLPLLLLLFVFTYGVCCYLMHFGVYVEDLAYITSILLKMLMYFTGIFYSIEKRVPSPYGHMLTIYNPMAYLITSLRNILLYQKQLTILPMMVWFFISILVAVSGTRLIYKNENSYVKVI